MCKEEERRLAILGYAVLYLFPDIFRSILSNVFRHPMCLSASCRNDTAFRTKLTKEEEDVLNRVDSEEYNCLSLQLCYKLFRYYHWLGHPGQGWGEQPTESDLNVADDIERIRMTYNTIIPLKSVDMDDSRYFKLIANIKHICERIENKYSMGTTFSHRCPLRNEELDTRIKSILKDIPNQQIIQDDPFPEIPVTAPRSRYARLCMVVQDIFPKIYRKLICKNIPAETLHRQIQKCPQEHKLNKLTHEEWKNLKSLKNGFYDELDFVTIYKLMRSFQLIDSPTGGWGNKPQPTDITVSDDVERLRIFRNSIVHKIEPEETKQRMNDFFTNSRDIAKRLDVYLSGCTFEKDIANYQTCSLAPDMEKKYIESIREIEDLKERFSEEEIHFYYGKSFDNFIQTVKREEITGKKRKIVIILEDIDATDEETRILNDMKEEINKGRLTIQFERATTGSLILHVFILDTTLSSEDQFYHDLSQFLKTILQICELWRNSKITVIMINELEELDLHMEFDDRNDICDCFAEIPVTQNSLRLEFSVADNFFSSDKTMQTELGGVVNRIIKSNGLGEKKNIAATISSCTTLTEIAMSSQGLVEFSELGRGFYKGYTYLLTKLFDECDFSLVSGHRHTICFKEASKRLRKAIFNAFEYIEIQSSRMVIEFEIGKTFVNQRVGVKLSPIQHSDWSTARGICKTWQKHELNGDDGMIVLGCITPEIIPKGIREANKGINMTEQTYASGLARSLIQYYLFEQPDHRLRNKDVSEETDSESFAEAGGVIYVTYKLEPRDGCKVQETKIKIEPETLQINPVALDLLKHKLELDGLYFRGDIPNDGNSFFRACSDQLERLEMPAMGHAELRQKVVNEMKLLSEKDVAAANVTKSMISIIENDGENVNDNVVQIMGNVLRRKIIVCSRSYSDEISKCSFNDAAGGTPLLLAKEKFYYQSLERSQQIPSSSSAEEKKSPKKPGKTVKFDESEPPSKQRKQDETILRNQTTKPVTSATSAAATMNANRNAGEQFSAAPSTSTAAAESIPVSKQQPTTGSKKQNTTFIKKMTRDEKLLILRCYMALSVKTDWDQLAELVYGKRNEKLSREIVQHYEQNLEVSTTLKSRIKSFVQKVLKDKGEKSEKDPEIKALINLL